MGGGGDARGTRYCPQSTPSLKAAPTEWPEGPHGACKTHPGEKGRSSRCPLPGPPLWGLVKNGESGGWNRPLLPRALTPGKEAAYPASALEGMLGAQRGGVLPPPHSFPYQDP